MSGAREKVSEDDDTINIDYTDLQPGDDAQDVDLAAAKAQLQPQSYAAQPATTEPVAPARLSAVMSCVAAPFSRDRRQGEPPATTAPSAEIQADSSMARRATPDSC